MLLCILFCGEIKISQPKSKTGTETGTKIPPWDNPGRDSFLCSGVLSVHHTLGQDVSQDIGTGHDDGGNLGDIGFYYTESQQQGSDEAYDGRPEFTGSQFLFPVQDMYQPPLLYRRIGTAALRWLF